MNNRAFTKRERRNLGLRIVRSGTLACDSFHWHPKSQSIALVSREVSFRIENQLHIMGDIVAFMSTKKKLAIADEDVCFS